MKQAILVVSFGTSYLDTLQHTIAATEQAIAHAFPGWEVRRAFTSGMILRKLRHRDNLYIHSVPEAMEALLAEGFTRVVVQSTHIMHGEEYEKLCTLLQPYTDRMELHMGMPLLHALSDYTALAQALADWYPPLAPDQALLLMGHGTEHFANAAYCQVDYLFRRMGLPIYLGTVEGYPELAQILAQLDEQPKIRKLVLAPFMLVAGDHAQNDLAGEEDSWKAELEALGYSITCFLHGLGECPAVQQLFVQHCRAAMPEKSAEESPAIPGKLYGVGVGPGDPELITQKALGILRRADVILTPDTGAGRQTAGDIVRTWLGNKPLQPVHTPMTRDKQITEQAYSQIAEEICTLLEQGKQVAFLTLGDPTIYSTYIYVHNKVLERGYPAEIIPGVPSFCAAAASLNTSLCQGEEELRIIPASAQPEALRQNRVYMKAGKGILELQQMLRQEGTLDHAAMVENCGMPDQQLYPRFGELDRATGYFSLVIVKEEAP